MFSRTLLLTVLVLLCTAPRAVAAIDLFLYVDGIPGESRDRLHEDWIDILSYAAPVSNPGSVTGGAGGGAGKAVFGDLSVSAFQSVASPELLLHAANGAHIDEVRLDIVNAGAEPRLIADWTLLDVIVTSFQTGGSGGSDRIVESYAFNYGKLRFRTYDEAGTPTVHFAWDVAANGPTTFPGDNDPPPPPPIPEPASAALMAAGVALAVWPSRRRRGVA